MDELDPTLPSPTICPQILVAKAGVTKTVIASKTTKALVLAMFSSYNVLEILTTSLLMTDIANLMFHCLTKYRRILLVLLLASIVLLLTFANSDIGIRIEFFLSTKLGEDIVLFSQAICTLFVLPLLAVATLAAYLRRTTS
jgi:hypothetical protein